LESRWHEGSESDVSAPKISDYAIIGDGRSAALISRDASIDWLCWPRFESDALFARILDPGKGGSWRISPTGPFGSRRSYVDGSNVLDTELESADGEVRVVDFMPVFSEDDKRQSLVPEHEILRIVECTRGSVELEVRFRPKLDYGLRSVRLRSAGALGIRVEDGPHLYTLRSDVPLEARDDGCAEALFRVRAGERRHFSLTYDVEGPAVLPPLGERSEQAARRTIEWWREWLSRSTYRGPYAREVERSLLTLKLLSYAPSGAIVAAPTTSLPERVGGDLNWDYRFCWLRDAALTVRQLLDLGYTDEANAFVSWLVHCTRLTQPRLSVLYDVFGELPRNERVLPELAGHRDSRPVRIQNAAVDQLQLDAYGEVIDAVALVCRHGTRLDHDTQKMLRLFGEYVCQNWQRADHGIWEPRGAPRHHTHSRVLCWVALDRLLELHRMGALEGAPAAAFEEQARLIRCDVERNAWSPALRSFTQSLGGNSVDASLLLLAWYGFVDPSEPRMRQTFERVRERLAAGPGLLFRYEASRDVAEGAFGICSFWACELLARGAGSLDEAERWFQELLGYQNDVGLFAEEISPVSGEPLGNFPQAFTHVGLIGAAVALEERRRVRS
jgi:GH15 family glucan-1,4-alpha-glucosidase